MTGDDLRTILLGRTLFRLDTILAGRLVPLLYASGLAAVLLWAVAHLFVTFGRNFGDGLWGLLEIVVFGLLSIVVLRIVCEVLLVYFKANETAARTVGLSRASNSLIEDVREAIGEIADEEHLSDAAPPPAGTPSRRSRRARPPGG